MTESTRFDMLPSDLKEDVLAQNQNTIAVYSTEVCPKCQRLKAFMESLGISFKKLNMETPEALTELRFNGIYVLEAPVLQINDTFYTTKKLFQGNELKEEIKALLGQLAK